MSLDVCVSLVISFCCCCFFRVIPEVVLNNMAEQGLQGTGSAGTSYNSDNLDFLGVPYDYHDFHNTNMCSTDGNYTSALQAIFTYTCLYFMFIDMYRLFKIYEHIGMTTRWFLAVLASFTPW